MLLRVVAHLDASICDLETGANRGESHTEASDRTPLCKRQRRTHNPRWPSPSQVYVRLAQSVMAELTEPRVCARCKGTGQRSEQGTPIVCPRCQGTGHLPKSDLARAKRLGMTWHAYTKSWKEPYEWTLSYCVTAVEAAASALVRKLG
jgi:uncharacterized phage protein